MGLSNCLTTFPSFLSQLDSLIPFLEMEVIND